MAEISVAATQMACIRNREGQCYFNSIAIIDADGSVLGVYRKSHIPNVVDYQEKTYFTPGDPGLVHSFDLDMIRQYRHSWGLFRDRRPDLYGDLVHHTPGIGI